MELLWNGAFEVAEGTPSTLHDDLFSALAESTMEMIDVL